MSYLQILNAALMAFGAAMGVIMGVVLLMYAVHLDEAPRLQRELPMLVATLGGFLLLSLFGGLSWWGHRRGSAWGWVAQAALMVSLALLVGLLLQLRLW